MDHMSELQQAFFNNLVSLLDQHSQEEPALITGCTNFLLSLGRVEASSARLHIIMHNDSNWSIIMQKSFKLIAINYTFAPVDLQATSNLVKVVKIMIAESNLFARTWKLGEQQALSNQNTSQIE